VKLDSISDWEAVPSKRDVVVVGNGFMSARAERGCKGKGDLSLERIAGDIAHLTTNGVEALSLTLPDLD
jgi:hypothetical protein